MSITSYGGLAQGIQRLIFFSGRSIPRNREIIRVYRELDFVEQLGSGMNRILTVYSEDTFKISENSLEVCFPFEKEYAEELSEENEVIISGQNGNSPENVGKTSGKRRENVGKDFGPLSR